MRIGEITELLRCQVYRKEDQKGEILEIAPEDFQSVSNLAHFAPKKAKTQVRINIGSRSDKFVLNKNDILLRTIGSKETVGTTCFMTDTPDRPTIPARNLIILRPDLKIIDPVWLFYRLSQSDIQEYLRKNITGSRPSYIKNDIIKEIEIENPTENAIKSVHLTHKRFMEHFWTLENMKNDEANDWQNLTDMFTTTKN